MATGETGCRPPGTLLRESAAALPPRHMLRELPSTAPRPATPAPCSCRRASAAVSRCSRGLRPSSGVKLLCPLRCERLRVGACGLPAWRCTLSARRASQRCMCPTAFQRSSACLACPSEFPSFFTPARPSLQYGLAWRTGADPSDVRTFDDAILQLQEDSTVTQARAPQAAGQRACRPVPGARPPCPLGGLQLQRARKHANEGPVLLLSLCS